MEFIVLHRYSGEVVNIKKFDCGEQSFNDFLCDNHDLIADGYNVGVAIHYIIEPESKGLIGYIALSASAVYYEDDKGRLGRNHAIYINRFAIDLKYQKQGLAKRILEKVLEEDIKMYAYEFVGAKWVVLNAVANDVVMSLYKDIGFEEIGRSYESEVEPNCIAMFREIIW